MRNLKPLPDDPLLVFDAILQRVEDTKEKPRAAHLRGLRDRLARAYRRYYERRAYLERLKRLGNRIKRDEAEALVYAYTHKMRGGAHGLRSWPSWIARSPAEG